jgi:cytochrome c biogenesis protein CcmG, thiol:disulfide interchange protein DsbE
VIRVAARSLALLVVGALFAVLVYRLVRDPGRALLGAVAAHRAPQAPDLRLHVIWPRTSTWPAGLRALAARDAVDLKELRGYPVVLNFWASWCGPCRREAGVLASAAQARRGRVVFVGIDVNDLTGDARRFLVGHEVPYVALRSGSSVIDRFGLVGLPETFYLDAKGRIRGITQGEVSGAALDRQLDRAAQAARSSS